MGKAVEMCMERRLERKLTLAMAMARCGETVDFSALLQRTPPPSPRPCCDCAVLSSEHVGNC